MQLTLVNVWQDTTLSDCDVAEELVQFLIVSDGELKMTRDDSSLLIVTSGVPGEFENFSGEVLKDSSEVDWSTGTDTLGVVAFPQETVNSADWERETSF